MRISEKPFFHRKKSYAATHIRDYNLRIIKEKNHFIRPVPSCTDPHKAQTINCQREQVEDNSSLKCWP